LAVAERKGGAGPGIWEVGGGFDERVTLAWRESGLAGAERDAAYLNWRYSKEGALYSKFLVGSGAGFMVLKEYRGGASPVAHVCELVLRAESRSMVSGALDFAVRWAGHKKCAQLTAWLPAGHPYEPSYEAAGLKLDPPTHRLCAELPESARGSLGTLSGWHLSHGDSDVY
jgi:hypothetical protein